MPAIRRSWKQHSATSRWRLPDGISRAARARPLTSVRQCISGCSKISTTCTATASYSTTSKARLKEPLQAAVAEVEEQEDEHPEVGRRNTHEDVLANGE